jgi:hypothetical protein
VQQQRDGVALARFIDGEVDPIGDQASAANGHDEVLALYHHARRYRKVPSLPPMRARENTQRTLPSAQAPTIAPPSSRRLGGRRRRSGRAVQRREYQPVPGQQHDADQHRHKQIPLWADAKLCAWGPEATRTGHGIVTHRRAAPFANTGEQVQLGTPQLSKFGY